MLETVAAHLLMMGCIVGGPITRKSSALVYDEISYPVIESCMKAVSWGVFPAEICTLRYG